VVGKLEGQGKGRLYYLRFMCIVHGAFYVEGYGCLWLLLRCSYRRFGGGGGGGHGVVEYLCGMQMQSAHGCLAVVVASPMAICDSDRPLRALLS